MSIYERKPVTCALATVPNKWEKRAHSLSSFILWNDVVKIVGQGKMAVGLNGGPRNVVEFYWYGRIVGVRNGLICDGKMGHNPTRCNALFDKFVWCSV